MTVVINSLQDIANKLGINENGRTSIYAINECYRRMDKYVPMDKGNLRTIVDINSHSITYESPYAHVQYVGERDGIKFHNYTTPGTGPYWDERMKSAEMKDLCKDIERFMGR